MNPQLTTSNNKNSLTKIYYPNPTTTTTNYPQASITTNTHENRKNNEIQQQQQGNSTMQYRQNVTSAHKRGINSGNILQYYYNNINNNEYTATNVNNNGEYLAKQSNININNIFAISNNQQEKLTLEKNQFSSTIRPLALKVSTPKQVSNFFTKTFRSDSQKRPLLLNYSSTNNEFHDANIYGPNFKIIPDKTGLKISPIYSISQNIDKYTPRKLRQQSTYFRNGDNGNASSSRPLFVRK